VHAHGDGDRRIDGGDLLERDEIGAGVEAESTQLLGDEHAEEPELA